MTQRDRLHAIARRTIQKQRRFLSSSRDQTLSSGVDVLPTSQNTGGDIPAPKKKEKKVRQVRTVPIPRDCVRAAPKRPSRNLQAPTTSIQVAESFQPENDCRVTAGNDGSVSSLQLYEDDGVAAHAMDRETPGDLLSVDFEVLETSRDLDIEECYINEDYTRRVATIRSRAKLFTRWERVFAYLCVSGSIRFSAEQYAILQLPFE